MTDATTRIQGNALVSTRLDTDARIAGEIRIGGEAFVEYRDGRHGEQMEIRCVVTQGRRVGDTHIVGLDVVAAEDAPGVSAGDEVVVLTGYDETRASKAPVLRQSTLDETEVGADARVRTPDATFDKAANEGEGWRTGHQIASEVGKHPMRG